MCHYLKNFYNLLFLYLYFLISLKTASCDNIDEEFLIIFTHKKSDSVAKQQVIEQNFGSYFGYSLSVSQENNKN
jgi:hypothetical protein